MSAGAAANQAGPSSLASKDKKVKRVRKRMRNKKRTTEVEDSSGSSDSDSSDDEEQKSKAAPVAEKPKSTVKKVAAADSDDDDSDDDVQGGDADEKRKRKRKRNTKKKAAEDTPKTAPAPAPTSEITIAATASTAKPITLSPEEVGPDPNTDLRLSDQAKQAIQYAQVYTKDKSQWKFNKAKQNWLLRNALSVPPSDYDPALARKQPDSTATAEDAAEDAEDAEEGENFVPEDFVLVVTAYLNSVMGGARLRLIESLKEAVNAPVITVAPTQAEVTDEASNDTATNEATTDEKAEGAATTKSVSFGNLALETEKKEEAAEAAGLPAGTDPQAVELRRARAKQMLQCMGEPF
ncbi:uncharacterized protein UTRI_01887_B [Ustilago trichophora]|uniref:WKF domain-containing protein n=1 Tax=Ustilago trichophora TaxID=86804 RepID=A0A5C3DXU8_9BASI|nr:uncharacterized protein UTRI_01887_B [Ustilago trichophora]